MFRCWRPNVASVVRCWSAVGAVAVLLSVTSAAHASITATGEPGDRYGTTPDVFTVDPFSVDFGGPPDNGHNSGLTQDRKIHQTFKNPTSINVGQINFSFDVGGGSGTGADNTGIRLAFYEVADVNAGSWTAGTLIKEIVLQPGNMPGSTEVFRLDLTGGNVFNLPQRDAGTTGYGIEFSTPNASPTDGNPGTLWFTDRDTDYYPDGRYYAFTGGSSSTRDIGISLVASTAPLCDPGDVDCAGGVTVDDLNIIAAHFRQNGEREDGDLTGDGFIDFDDFGEWKQYYTGPGLGSDAFAFLSVPEPASTSLLFFGVIGLLTGVRRRRRDISRV
jgi:PEP-CTERM motif